jgi:D-sedoheptulose 7-phosphate isomerase
MLPYYCDVESKILSRFLDFQTLLGQFYDFSATQIKIFAQELLNLFDANHKLLICGNGGSAADSQHIAAEFVSSFAFGLNRKSLPVISLTTDTSILTAISNDFDFKLVFGRQVEGLGLPGDGLLVISTSGESSNCILAAEIARNIGMKVFSLTRTDSTLVKKSDHSIAVPSKNTQYIQQCHMVAYHIVVELIENSLIERSKS